MTDQPDQLKLSEVLLAMHKNQLATGEYTSDQARAIAQTQIVDQLVAMVEGVKQGSNILPPTTDFMVAESRSGRDCLDCGNFYHVDEEVNDCTCSVHNTACDQIIKLIRDWGSDGS